MAKDFKKMDFFQYKVLADKDATFYVRNGKSFMYVGHERYDFDNPDKDGLAKKIGRIDAAPIDVNKDVVLNGCLWLWQKEEFYALVFFDEARSHPPIALKFGNALLED